MQRNNSVACGVYLNLRRINMMKIKKVLMILAASFTAISANAATSIATTEFNAVMTSAVFSVTAKGWSDPAFGDAGWTHSSQWATVTAKKGQTVTITSVADNLNVHPAVSVWYRGALDTAPDNYVVDHFYPQNTNIFKSKAVDESVTVLPGEKAVSIGNIVMKYVAHGFDLDKNTVTNESGAIDSESIAFLKGKRDGVAGKFALSFKAAYDGNYMFAVGGYNPNKNYVAATGADGKALKESIKVSVSVK